MIQGVVTVALPDSPGLITLAGPRVVGPPRSGTGLSSAFCREVRGLLWVLTGGAGTVVDTNEESCVSGPDRLPACRLSNSCAAKFVPGVGQAGCT